MAGETSGRSAFVITNLSADMPAISVLFQRRQSKQDIVIEKLEQKWFAMAMREKYPRTPAVSRELDNIEIALVSLRAGAKAKVI